MSLGKHARDDSIEDIAQEGADEPVRKKRDALSRNWFLTWNNYDDESIKTLLGMDAVKYVIQEEKGEEGTPHLQGVMCWKHKKSWSWLRNIAEIYWKPAKNVMACKQYCSKVETANGKMWVKGFVVEKRVKDPLAGKRLYSYQREILDMVRGIPDDRKIFWYWSDKGAIGKSSLCKHMCLKLDAILVGGKYRDAYYGIAEKVKQSGGIDIVIFDIPRFSGNKVSYIGIEGIKNGCFYNTKYESTMCLYDPPHIVIFANQSPDMGSLSTDRWVVKNLDGEADLGHIADQMGRRARVPDNQQGLLTPPDLSSLDSTGYGNYGNSM